jgi:hypothetical protein
VRADAAAERIRKSFLWEDRARHAQDVRRDDDVALFRLAGRRDVAALHEAVARAGGEVVASVQPALGVSLSLVVRAPDLGAVEASVRSALGVTP